MAETKLTLGQKIKKFTKAITVEPVALLMLTGTMLSITATQTLALDKTCRVNMELPNDICDSLRNQDTDDMDEFERIVQEHVANLYAYKSIIGSVLPCLVLIFAGGWMDLTGRRKIMMIATVTGEILAQSSNIINVIFFYQLRVEYLIFFEGAFGAIFGGWNILFLAIFSYIADITTEKNRTFRLGLVSFCIYIGMPLGMSLSGFVLKNFGYITVYLSSLTMALVNMSYLIFIFSDPERTKEHKIHDNRGFFYFLKSFFSLSHFLNSVKTVFRKKGDKSSTLLIIFVIITCFLFAPMYGETAVTYMSVRYRFSWDEVQYSIFQTYNLLLNISGTIFAMLVIIRKLGWHDALLGILSTCSKILGGFVYCFATAGWMFYIGSALDILNGTSFIAIRSIMSKSVEPHEIAKMNSIFGIAEALLPLVAIPLYTQIYTATMQTLPGAVFLVGIGLTTPPLLCFSWLFYKHRKTVSNKLNETDKS